MGGAKTNTMTELQLYKYIQDNAVEWHWSDNEGTPDVLIFPYFFNLSDFTKLLGKSLVNIRVECVLTENCACIWMRDICENCDIELENVFPKDHE